MAEFNALRKALEDDTASDQSAVYDSEGLGPIESWSDDLVVMAAGQGRPEAVAERERRIRGISKVKEPSGAGRAFLEKVTKRIGDFVAEQERIPSPSAGSLRPSFGLPPVGRQQTVAIPASPRAKEEIPESLRRSESDWVMARSEPIAASASELPSLGVVPVPPPDTAPTVPRIAPSDLKTPESQPIPTASAPVTKDAAAPVVSVVPSTGPQTPAGKPESMGTPGLPAPSSDGAGGDASERDLYLARLAAQSAAGFGGMGAGKSIDMGIADTLGERLKQVQALRAKREEQSLVDARERANNRAQVEYLMQRFPERREALAGLLDVTKSPNFAQMLRVEEQIALDKARQAQAAATTGQIQALTPVKVEAGLAGAEGKRAQTKSRTYTDALTQAKTENEIARKGMIAAQAEALRAKAELDKAKAAGAGDTDSRTVNARQKLVDAYQKQYLAPAESLAAVEAKAPGLTRGQPPDWLTGEQLQLVRNNVTYELASDDTKDVFAAAQKYLDGYRKQQYGSALTAVEQAELERLVKADIFTGADKLSRFFDLIRKDIANNFQNKLKGDRLVQQSFVDKYVGAEEGPLTKFVGPQGLFSDVWTLAKAPAAGETQQPAKKPAPREGIRWMLSPEGSWKGVKEADVEKAKASGFRE